MQTMNGATATSSTTINSSSDWTVVAVGDFNGDGKADILWQQSSTGITMMQTMNGTAVVASYLINSNPDWSIAGVGDFDGDGKADILEARVDRICHPAVDERPNPNVVDHDQHERRLGGRWRR